MRVTHLFPGTLILDEGRWRVEAWLIEALFVLVFVRALAAYAARRDPVQRDVMLVFSAIAVLFVIGVVRKLVPSTPGVFNTLASALLLAQPFLTLRLAGRLRPIPRWLLATAFAGWAVSVGLLLPFGGRLPPPGVLFVVVVFVCTELIASGYFVAEAVRRSGAPSVRLATAGVATMLFAVAIAVSGASAAHPQAAPLFRAWAQGIGLVSAVGCTLAFMPPRWLRAWWSGPVALSIIRQLHDAAPTETPEATWRRYAGIVAGVGGADGVVVVMPDAKGARVVTGFGTMEGRQAEVAPDLLHGLLAGRQPVRVDDLPGELAGLGRGGVRYVMAVPVRIAGPENGALILLHRYRMLFDEDDVRLLGELGTQAAVLAERGAARLTQERLAADLSASVRALSAANQAKSDFLSAMSHELRTPLNAIIGFSELMRGEQPDGDRRRVPADWIEHVFVSGRHLLGLINDVLDLAKVESGRVDLEFEELDLPQVVEETVASLQPLAERKQLSLRAELAAPTVWADPNRLRQILNNLLSNAIKFTPEGGRIAVAAELYGGQVALAVTDTGVGIAPADQLRVFEEFQQVGDLAARQAGTGLGLALTRRLVEAHGGHIELWSQPGEGSRFTVFLPATEPVAHAGEQAEPAGPAPGQLTVLVVEDDLGAQQLLRTYLESAGYHVLTAGTGEQGLALVQRFRPAAVLLDLVLPGMDGWTVLRRLKQEAELCAVPVFIATVIDEREIGLAEGADDYFVKPIDRNRLLNRLAQRLLPGGGDPRGARALAIDHDREVLALIEAALQERGFEVIAVTTGQEALRRARTEPFDLIVSDLALPDLDHVALLKALSEDPELREIPVLVLDPRSAGGTTEQGPVGTAVADHLHRQLAGLAKPSSGVR